MSARDLQVRCLLFGHWWTRKKGSKHLWFCRRCMNPKGAAQ